MGSVVAFTMELCSLSRNRMGFTTSDTSVGGPDSVMEIQGRGVRGKFGMGGFTMKE